MMIVTTAGNATGNICPELEVTKVRGIKSPQPCVLAAAEIGS